MSEIKIDQLFDTLKNTKKYSGENFIYEYNNDVIVYLIDGVEYRIYCNLFRDKNNFRYSDYKSNIQSIIIPFKNETQIILKFGQIVKYINKLHDVLTYKQSIKDKLKNVLISYIKNEYDFNLDFEENVTRYDLRLSSYYIRYKKRYKTVAFDIKKNDASTVKYDIFLGFKSGLSDYNDNAYKLVLQYSISDNNLILLRKEITYSSNNDITSIIRSEKLKKLKFLANV